MAILRKGDWKAPFFGKSSDYTTGRDALGLQTTSQATYSTLLQGLTNLTNRIRYYGFYSWLLEVYAKEVGDTSPSVQNRFMRRGEYMMALVMELHQSEALQIAGSLFAAEEIKNQVADSAFDISRGADKEQGRRTYWKYSSGAFGQYYAGAMQTLGLIIQREDTPVFVCTKHENEDIVTGTRLAKAFAKNLSPQTQKLFIQNINDGILRKSESKELFNEFSLTNIPPNTEEWVLYDKMLFSNDQPLYQSVDNVSYFRRDSIKCALSYIKKIQDPEKWNHFTHDIYRQKGKDFEGIETNSSLGWYYYQLNEYWHFGVETIFWGLLETLSSKYFQVPLDVFVTDFHETIVEACKQNGLIESESQTLETVIENLEIFDALELSNDIKKCVKDKDVSKGVFFGFKMLFVIYKQNHDRFYDLKTFALTNGMERSGDCISGLNEFRVGGSEMISNSLKRFLVKNIINRHLEVAYRKMGTGTKNTLKFSFEDNYLRHIETISPVWTTPRIYAMYSCLKDLRYVNPDGKISEVGIRLIET